MNQHPVHPDLRRRRPAPRHMARGMTLLEVVLAVLVMGLVASSVASALAFVFRQERQDDLRLAANELANRLILQYLDDDSVIDDLNGRPLQYGTSRFQWDLDVANFALTMKEPETGSGRPSGQYKNRFEVVTVRVWLHSDDARGRMAGLEQGPEPLAELSRMLDPGAVRNNDAMMRLGEDQNRLMKLVGRMGIIQGDPGSNTNRRGSRHGNPRTSGDSRGDSRERR